MTHRLILLRHGVSEFSHKNVFAGWYDAPLSETGRAEAHRAAALLADAGVAPTVAHTSRLDRAIETAEIVLRGLGQSWVDVRRSWQLNTMHWGDFTGQNKMSVQARYGIKNRRREYSTSRPPPVRDDNEFNPNVHPMYGDLPSVPRCECLADVERRVLPYWNDALAPDLRSGHTVLVVASGIPLTMLIGHLDRSNRDYTADGRMATAIPFLYELDSEMKPVESLHHLDRALDRETAASHFAATSDGGWDRAPTRGEDAASVDATAMASAGKARRA